MIGDPAVESRLHVISVKMLAQPSRISVDRQVNSVSNSDSPHVVDHHRAAHGTVFEDQCVSLNERGSSLRFGAPIGDRPAEIDVAITIGEGCRVERFLTSML